MKIKKFLQFVLPILVILVIISPVTILAQEPTGTCFIKTGPQVGYTKTQCDDYSGTWVPGTSASDISPTTNTSGSPFNSTSTACAATVNNIGDIICKMGVIVRSLIPLLLALGVLYFVWGVVQYVIGGDEEAKKKGKNRIIYGLIGLVVIVGLAGLINIVINTFGLSQGNLGLVSPSTTLAQNDQTTSNFGLCSLPPGNPKLQDFLSYVTCIIGKSVIPLIFALAVTMFVWGVVQYVINSDDEAKKQKGRQFIIWGIIGLVVMVSVWGLVKIVGTTFGIEYAIPQLKSQ